MNVVIDMVDAETVIAGAAGTVAEFQIGILDIRAAADAALVMIELITLLLPDPAGRLPKIDRRTAWPFG